MRTVGVVSLVSAWSSRTLGCTRGDSGCFCVESPEPLSCAKTHRLGQGSHKHVVTVRFQHSVWWDFFPFEGKTSFRKLVFVLLSRVPVSPAPVPPLPPTSKKKRRICLLAGWQPKGSGAYGFVLGFRYNLTFLWQSCPY